MGRVENKNIRIIDYTANPISHIGKMSAICYDSPTNDEQRNLKRGLDIINKNHGEPIEFANITFEISGYSMRVFRELLRHRHTTKLQKSTRYTKSNDFEYYTPDSIKFSEKDNEIYQKAMNDIQCAYDILISRGVSKEDAANLLPLGTHSKVVIKINLRELLHIYQKRACKRALPEMRLLMKSIKDALRFEIADQEWKHIGENYLVLNCKECKEKCS